MKKPALLSLIRIPPLCAIQRCTSGTGPLATDCRRARSRLSGECNGWSRIGRAPKKADAAAPARQRAGDKDDLPVHPRDAGAVDGGGLNGYLQRIAAV